MRRALVSSAALEEGSTCCDLGLISSLQFPRAVRCAAPPAPERFADSSLPSLQLLMVLLEETASGQGSSVDGTREGMGWGHSWEDLCLSWFWSRLEEAEGHELGKWQQPVFLPSSPHFLFFLCPNSFCRAIVS